MYDTPYTNNYHSISGIDIKAVLGGVTFGNLQAISYSITREKAPIYTLGSPEPRGYSRGKRGIAGSLVFIMFDSHALLETFRSLAQTNPKYQFVSDFDESRPQLDTLSLKSVQQGRLSAGVAGGNQGVVTNAVNSNFEAGLELSGSMASLDSGWGLETPWYSDQIPAFNVSLTGVNEEGYASTMSVLGVEILNEGFGISIDDIVSEQQMTYVARGISPWTRVQGAKFQKGLADRWGIPVTQEVMKRI
jgi:hypothetical protein